MTKKFVAMNLVANAIIFIQYRSTGHIDTIVHVDIIYRSINCPVLRLDYPYHRYHRYAEKTEVRMKDKRHNKRDGILFGSSISELYDTCLIVILIYAFKCLYI